MQAYSELKDVENWDEFNQMKGTINALEAIIEFPDSLESMIRQKMEEEKEREDHGNA